MKTVLVTGCGGGNGLCAARGLRAERNNWRIIGVDADPHSAFIYFKNRDTLFDRTYLISHANEQKYVTELLKLCQIENVDVILPCSVAEMERFSLEQEKFEKHGIKVVISPRETILTCGDKWLTYTCLNEYLPMAKSALPSIGVEKALNYTGLPAIVKPRTGWGSRQIYKVNTLGEAETVVTQIPNPVIQEALEGEEYTVDCLADKHGKLVCAVPRKRSKIYGGLSFQGITTSDNELIELAAKITNHLKFVGPFFFQLRKNAGKAKIFEINARLAGTSILSIKAGANLPLLAVKDLCDISIPSRVDFEEGLFMSRFFDEVFFKNNLQNLRVRAVIFDLDDTLYDEKQFVKSGFRTVASQMSEKIGVGENSLYHLLLDQLQENGREKVFDLALKKLGLFSDVLVTEMLRIYRTHLPEIAVSDEDKKVLAEIRKRFLTGVVTDGIKSVQENKIRALKLENFFDVIVYASEYNGKENIKCYSVALEKLGVKPCDSIYIDDSPERLLVAKQLGITTIRLLNNENRTLPVSTGSRFSPDYEINSLKEIFKVVGSPVENAVRNDIVDKEVPTSSVEKIDLIRRAKN